MTDPKNKSFEDQVKGMKEFASKMAGEVIDKAGELKEIIEKLKAFGVKVVEAAKSATYTRK